MPVMSVSLLKQIAFKLSGIVLGSIFLLLIIGCVGFVGIKGLPPTIKNMYTDTKESIAAKPQYSHSVMNTTYSGSYDDF